MSDIHINHLVFYRGIESITHAQQQPDMRLPERSDAPPPDISMRTQLEQLLQKPSLDTLLDAYLRPQLQHRDVLLRRHRQMALTSARKRLRAAAGAAAEDSDASRVLQRAERLLNEENQLHELVEFFQGALYQG